MICDECQALYEEVADRVRQKNVFAKVRRNDEALRCWARTSAAPATYQAQVNEAHDTIWVGLHTEDRWLSESIETDLLHRGEKIEELLEEELEEQGWGATLPVEHFRDEAKVFVFRSPVAVPAGKMVDDPAVIDQVTRVLLAYEACFDQLGDMSK
jgi:hypothetical protein